MRQKLVDVSKIRYRYEWMHGVKELFLYKADIDNAPTVKAIPIEWIKRKAFENPSLSRNLFYRLIIEEWEKENANNN